MQVRVYDSLVEAGTEPADFPGYLQRMLDLNMKHLQQCARMVWADGPPGWLPVYHHDSMSIRLDGASGGQVRSPDMNCCAVLACLRMATLVIALARNSRCDSLAEEEKDWQEHQQLSREVLIRMPNESITAGRRLRELVFDTAVLGSFFMCGERLSDDAACPQ